jgi:hypothetical protein
MSIRTVGSRKSSQSLERSAGLPAPLDPATYYRVDPGEASPEYFPNKPGQSMLTALCDAIARAGFLSVGLPPQRVLATRPEGHRLLRACQDQVIRRFRGGQEIWSARTGEPDPGDSQPAPAPAAATFALKGI